MECRLILIDYDGTIIDSKKFHQEGLAEFLKKYDIPFKKEDLSLWLGEKTETILKKLKISKTDIEGIIQEVNKEKMEHLNKIKLIQPSTFFRKLSRKNKLIIISNAEIKFIKNSAKKLKIDKYFTAILGEENFKDKTDGIKKMLKKYKIKPKEAV